MALEYLGVLAASDFANYLVVFLVAPVDGEGFVVPVVAGAVDVDVGVDSLMWGNYRGGVRSVLIK